MSTRLVHHLQKDEEYAFGREVLDISGNIALLLSNRHRYSFLQPFDNSFLLDLGIQLAKVYQKMTELILPQNHPMTDVVLSEDQRQAFYAAGRKAELSMQAYKRLDREKVIHHPDPTFKFYISLIGILNGSLVEMHHVFLNRGAMDHEVPIYRNQDLIEFMYLLEDIIAYISPQQTETLHTIINPRTKSSVDLRYQHLLSFYDFVYLAEHQSQVNYWSRVPHHERILRNYQLHTYPQSLHPGRE